MKNILKSHPRFFLFLSYLMDPVIVFSCTIFFFKVGIFSSLLFTKIIVVVTCMLVPIIFPMADIYRSWRGDTLLREARTVFMAWLAVFVTLSAVIFFVSGGDAPIIDLSRDLPQAILLIAWFVFCYLMLVACHLLVRITLRILRSHGYNHRKVIIIGAGQLGQKIADYLNASTSAGISVLGFFDDKQIEEDIKPNGNGSYLPLLGTVEDAIDYTAETKPDMVIIALPVEATQKIYNLIWRMGISGISLMIATELFTFGPKKQQVRYYGNIPIVAFNLYPPWKRIFDILFSILALIMISPLMLLIALFVKLEDGGPVFFKHKRVCEYCKHFDCLKFRTMHLDADKRLLILLENDPELKAEWEKNYKLKKDPRITRVGRVIRKISLDELPQFINVLKGEMSVVGARPVVKDELFSYYNQSVITYCATKPGITGPWQIGKRNDIDNYNERVEQDHRYIMNNSFWLDLRIIFKTILVLFSGKGAY